MLKSMCHHKLARKAKRQFLHDLFNDPLELSVVPHKGKFSATMTSPYAKAVAVGLILTVGALTLLKR